MADGNQEQVAKYIIEHAQPFKVELNRGMHGRYSWTISMHGARYKKLLKSITLIDGWLRDTFGEQSGGE